eukprot:3478937-Alexandrium_andersonii.AAC.1
MKWSAAAKLAPAMFCAMQGAWGLIASHVLATRCGVRSAVGAGLVAAGVWRLGWSSRRGQEVRGRTHASR